ncbi:basic leucine zipper nuclear factor 1 blzf1 protein [Holotrichia oblita]|uniref:Basic leucine zipper nuclear factor 1 blzf1 protein n=1 Tax=Holotrichia oblita TaxID=644536 RepID=A0ACB9SZX5_HOLOL|nr:basic leucine zipper nuclear factor 1 blzf1 protein [Holotrichia oblita]
MHLFQAERTLGDGMDNNLMALSDSANENVPFRLNLRSSQAILNSLKPIEPNGKVITLEPKFIPYEPFKGAVEPIVPIKKVVKREPKDKNNIDIHDLVIQMSEMRMQELNKAKIEAIKGDEEVITRKQWDHEKKSYETDIKNLQETNAHLENQLKFQAQVNRELKTLLVAAVGEDLESRVQHLTEDKLQLARALLKSANHLTSHQEQTEWLSGQCEVWRSKFLASSLMVEELARWKSVLTNRLNDLQDVLKCLIDERNKTRSYSIKCLNNLNQMNEQLCKNENVPLKSSNILEVCMNNFKISEALTSKLMEDEVLNSVEYLSQLPSSTPAESCAVQLLKNPITLTSKPDAICNAVMGAAMSLSAGQIYLQHPLSHAACCAHCKGEVQDI